MRTLFEFPGSSEAGLEDRRQTVLEQSYTCLIIVGRANQTTLLCSCLNYRPLGMPQEDEA